MIDANLKTKKKVLLNKLDNLNEKYPEDNIYSLDKWDETGFPKKLDVTICDLPDLKPSESEIDEYDDESEYRWYEKESFDQRNEILYNKYGFVIDYNDGDCVDFVVLTTKYGISPVGLDAKKVRNIVNDAKKLKF